MKLFVRVSAAAKTETFRRCGLRFSREGAEYEVDEATANRLCADQMLDCTEELEGADLENVDLTGLPDQTFDEALADTSVPGAEQQNTSHEASEGGSAEMSAAAGGQLSPAPKTRKAKK
jgi:hypothetical protein